MTEYKRSTAARVSRLLRITLLISVVVAIVAITVFWDSSKFSEATSNAGLWIILVAFILMAASIFGIAFNYAKMTRSRS